jgi:alpha-tubulin suppressor-like RCC1 family protein
MSTCAVVNGAAFCWGENDSGQLGNNSSAVSSPVPLPVQSLTAGVTGIATGGSHTCAIVNGGAQCWGYNANGQLGNATLDNSPLPVQVSGLTAGVTAIACGDDHCCAIVDDGVQCWGDSMFGSLGNGTTVAISTRPVQVAGLTAGATAISAGFNTSCAVVNGAVLCWGWNNFGQLGNGFTADAAVPVQVVGLTAGATQVATGYFRSCATVGGSMYCWGNNYHGGLGNGANGNSPVPVRVQYP